MGNYKILSDGVGNLLARIVRNKNWSVDDAVTRVWRTKDGVSMLKKDRRHAEMLRSLGQMRDLVEACLDRLDSKQALKEILAVAHAVSVYSYL